MYIRAVETKTKTGSTYTKYQLVESYRSEKGPRQRIILTLTDLDLAKPLWPALARVISDRLSGVESIFDEDKKIVAYADMVMTKLSVRSEITASDTKRDQEAHYERVDLNTAAHTKVRSLGAELIAERFYNELGFEEILRGAGLEDKTLPIAKAVILARLIHPGSDLATYRWIRDNSALAELAGIDLAKFTKDQVYEVADLLYGQKKTFERALFHSSCALFPTDETLFLFDLTNTYFEGNAKANTLAKYGHSKEKRYCALVSLALVVDSRGLPVYSEIYEGNVSEPRTLVDVLGHLEELRGETLFSNVTPTIVMDRGIATADNVALCIEKKLNYIVIERANKASRYKEHFQEMEGFSEV
ncbi:MAG: IS1634 family transposase, partial [Ferrimicrobium sp.]